MEISSQTSYKTLKVCLAAIWPEQLEQQFSNPTSDKIFYLMCRNIRLLKGDGHSCSHCPITINSLCMLKTQVSGILFWNDVYYGLPFL